MTSRILLLSFLLVSGPVFAIGPEPTFAVMGGANIASFSPASGYEAHAGLTMGGAIELPIKRAFYLELDGAFNQEGASLGSAGLAQNSLTSLITHYDLIQFAVLGKLKFGVPAMAVELLAGPTFGFAIQRSASSLAIGSTTAVESDLKNSLASSEFGLQIGMGAEFEVNEDSFLFGSMRYTFGLTSFSNTGSGKTTSVMFLSGIRIKM